MRIGPPFGSNVSWSVSGEGIPELVAGVCVATTTRFASVRLLIPPIWTSLMDEYSFEVGVRAVVRVQASDPDAARKVVESVLGAPCSEEVELINQKSLTVGRTATVAAVDFVQKTSAKLVSND